MADPRFYNAGAPITLSRIAELTGATLSVGSDAHLMVADVAPLSVATKRDVSFLSNARYLADFAVSGAGACFVTPELASRVGDAVNLLICAQPSSCFVTMAEIFHPADLPVAGTSPFAHVHPSARIGHSSSLAPGVVIGANAEIGDGCHLGAHTVVGPGVVLGSGSWVGAHVSITYALIGERVIIHAGARIGQDGFGFLQTARGLRRVPQLGRVVIGDDVEIGANTTIDRGAGVDTTIGTGTKIDNLVQIGHNCQIGAHCVIAAQTGLSGSVVIGDSVMLGGQVGVSDHISIGKGARVASKSGVMRDIPARASQGGYPARALRDWHRESIMMQKLLRSNWKDPA